MAKKKHKKKHSFQHKAVSPAVAATSSVRSAAHVAGKSPVVSNEWTEVSADVRRSLILAGIFIAIMIVLAFYLDGTTSGKALFRSITL